jgi:hypothetical protein
MLYSPLCFRTQLESLSQGVKGIKHHELVLDPKLRANECHFAFGTEKIGEIAPFPEISLLSEKNTDFFRFLQISSDFLRKST